jgi:hypothetical protein
LKVAVFLTALGLASLALPLVLLVLPFARRLALLLLVLSAVYIIDVNVLFDPGYRGMSRAFDVGTTDGLIVGLLLFHALSARRFGSSFLAPGGHPEVTPVVWLPPGLLPLLVFIAWCALTVLQSSEPLYGAMDLFKLLRGAALFWAAANVVRDDRLGAALPAFLLVYVGVEVLVCSWQFAKGMWWIPGTFTHKNSFALSTNMILPTILAVGLLGPRKKMALYLLAYAAGAACIILSRSRMGWFTMALSAAAVVAISLFWALRWRDRAQLRAQLVALGGAALFAMPILLQMADGIVTRMGEDREASLEFRDKNNFIALTFASWRLMGVGLNNYVAELRNPIGAILPDIDKTVAHHLYLLVAAETGWVGLGFFALALLSVLAIAMYTVLAGRKRWARVVSFGLLVGLCSAYLHSFLESDLLRRETYFIFCMLAGMLSGIHQREGLQGFWGMYWGLRRSLRKPAWSGDTAHHGAGPADPKRLSSGQS